MNIKVTRRLILYCIFFISFFNTIWAQSTRLKDSLTLVSLYNATNGANWVNKWNFSTPIDKWYGITLNENGCVKCIDLDGLPDCILNMSLGNNLVGNLPDLPLSELQTLILTGNKLTGNIPNFDLQKLELLQLSNNRFSGNIPNFNLKTLERLILNNNQLTGSITNINTPNLLQYSATNNLLTGNIPNFTYADLRILEFANNQLSGQIPNFKLNELQTIHLMNNLLNGAIPNFNLPKLLRLQLSNNQLSDSIPNFTTPEMQTLFLDNNQLTGKIPNFKTPNMMNLRLFNNKLTGSIPKFVMPKLEFLLLGNNQLTGTLPEFNMPILRILEIYSNKLSGNLPTLYFPALLNLFAQDNQFTGGIPDETYLPKLKIINVSYNRLDNLISELTPNITFSGEHNKLTFDDIIPNVLTFSTRTYAPQDSILPDTIISIARFGSLTLDLGVDKDVKDNKYEWFKNDVPFSTVVGNNKLVFANLKAADVGVYTCRITNPNAPLLILYTRTITLTLEQFCPVSPIINDTASISSVALTAQCVGCDWNLKPMGKWEGFMWDTLPNCNKLLTGFKPIAPLGQTRQLNGSLSPLIKNLKTLEVIDISYQLGFKGTIPDSISTLTALKNLTLFQTSVGGLVPASLKNMPNLEILVLQKSQFDSLPTLTNIPKLRIMEVSNNNFTFDDILPNIKAKPDSVFLTYAPQNPFFKDTTIISSFGKPININMGIDAGITNSKYKWFKNNVAIDSVSSNKYTISKAYPCDNGVYTVQVTNPLAPALTLLSRKITIQVEGTVPTKNQSLTVCTGQPIRLSSGKQIVSPGVYRDTFRIQSATCVADTLISVLDLKHTDNFQISLDTQICNGSTHILPDGKTTNKEGSFISNLKAGGGCDSTVTVKLKINETYNRSISATFCEGNNYLLPDKKIVTKSGTYPVFLKTIKGCDSLVNVNLKNVNDINARNDNAVFTNDLDSLKINLVENDALPVNSNWNVSIINQPRWGTVTSLKNGIFDYKLERSGVKADTFKYKVCYNTCPNNCDSATVSLSIKKVLYGANVPTSKGIIPNGNEDNRALRFTELEDATKYPESELVIINRWGQTVYKSKPYRNDWNGVNNSNQDLPAGTYYYILRLNLNDAKIKKGDVTIIR
jgi:gliding motility-associated-like protein